MAKSLQKMTAFLPLSLTKIAERNFRLSLSRKRARGGIFSY
ncbi:hypothetical protein [Rodentibacter ratti]|nr:hypothetical protein [Rodentibacter ratti]